MIDKDYLEKLKEEDYIAWDSLVNDPMITGGNSDYGFLLPIILMIIIVGFIFYFNAL